MEFKTDIEATCEMPKSRTIGSFYNLLGKMVRQKYPEVFQVMSKHTPPNIRSMTDFFLSMTGFFVNFAKAHGDEDGSKQDVILSGCMVEFRKFLLEFNYSGEEQRRIVRELIFVADRVEMEYRTSFAELKITDVSVSSDMPVGVPEDFLFPVGEDMSLEDAPVEERVTDVNAEAFLDRLERELEDSFLFFDYWYANATYFLYNAWKRETGEWGLTNMPAVSAIGLLHRYFTVEVPDCPIRREVISFIENYCFWNHISLPVGSHDSLAV
ncbi:MAG: hypothetical protein UV80_C0001G0002 [Candidatus Peregrinibacteria bacterium GW2011_GWF2_43_17]|nr:MAG: hypothetical protein UV80_C0001G0002 [Candidatus Peregrinibacteria bacterium GW2011_GWF2_43_17]KKT20401.1 MAG: hypothetical protein UW03_C0005G0036 [Candidatus Peregrinibacteria bacterium GW2011_GWA2_43_8]HAU40245.1 hypothetical protein [Candidatus Peregrinibacteria bacterium]